MHAKLEKQTQLIPVAGQGFLIWKRRRWPCQKHVRVCLFPNDINQIIKQGFELLQGNVVFHRITTKPKGKINQEIQLMMIWMYTNYQKNKLVHLIPFSVGLKPLKGWRVIPTCSYLIRLLKFKELKLLHRTRNSTSFRRCYPLCLLPSMKDLTDFSQKEERLGATGKFREDSMSEV